MSHNSRACLLVGIVLFLLNAHCWEGSVGEDPSDSKNPEGCDDSPPCTIEDMAQADNLWVDSEVALSGNGTHCSSPFKTIQEAADIARAGDTIQIRAGIYRETVVPANSGTQSAPITYQAYKDETVTISGAEPLSDWSQHSANIFTTTMANTLGVGRDQIFHTGQMQTWARWPNTDHTNAFPADWRQNHTIVPGTHNNGGYDIELSDADLPGDARDWVGAYLHIVPGKAWVHQTGAITSNSTGKTLHARLDKLGNSAAYTPANNDRYFLVGSLNALDSAGEWYRDDRDSKLYVWQPGGGSPGPRAVEYKHRELAFDLSNKSDIQLVGLSLFAATVATDKSTRITLDEIRSKYPSHYDLIGRSPWAMGTTDTGILLRGEDHTLQNSTISHSSGNGVTLQGSGHTLRHNTIHTINTMGTDAAGIYTVSSGSVGARNIEIAHNTIFDAGRSLITHRRFSASSIHHNELYRAMQVTKDGGATYTYGSPNDSEGTVIAFNHIYDNYPFGTPSEDGVAVGIYLDNGSANYIVTRNVVWDSSYAFLHNTRSTDQNHKVINNTFIGDQRAISSWGPENERNVNGTEFINNIVIGAVQSYLTDWNKSDSNYWLKGKNHIARAHFTDPATAHFTLQAASPARNLGAPDHWPAYTLGYTGEAPDAGAYEWPAKPFPVGALQPATFSPLAHSIAFTSTTVIKPGHYDILGARVSHHDSTPDNEANSTPYGSSRSTEAVDLTASSYLGWITEGEWLEFTIDVAVTGEYHIGLSGVTDFFVEDSVSLHVQESPVQERWRDLGTIQGGQSTSAPKQATLNAGLQVLRVTHHGSDFGYGALHIANVQQAYSALPIINLSSNTTIMAGHYDKGGELIAYHDTSAVNSAQGSAWGSSRDNEGVDVTEDGFVGWINDGEWLEYTVDVTEAGSYQFGLNNPSTFNSDDAISISVVDSLSGDAGPPLATLVGDSDLNSTAAFILYPGKQVLRLTMTGDGFGFLSFTLAPAPE